MREILFRGKSKETGEWVYGDLMHMIRSDPIIAEENGLSLDKFSFVKSDTVGQYTGLKDKNGVKIFEGDIVLTGVAKKKYSVRFCQGEYLLDADGNDIPCQMRENGRLSSQNTYYLKVIGNIYDNPELLEESKNE